MTTPNNAILWNAIVAGFVGGTLKSRPITAVNSGTPPVVGTPDPSYAAIVAQAVNTTLALDPLIPNDHAGAPYPALTQAISVVTTGVAISPTTGAITFAQIQKDLCLKALVTGIMESRGSGFPAQNSPASLAPFVTQVQQSYALFADLFVQPISSPATNNQLLAYAAYCGGLAGMMAGNPSLISNPTGVSFIQSALTQFGQDVDAAIATDGTITAASANGAALAANGTVTVPNIQCQIAKTQLMFSLAMAAMYGRDASSLLKQVDAGTLTLASFAAQVAPPVIAAYKAMQTSLLLIVAAQPPNLNPTLFNSAFCGFIAGNMAGRPFTSISVTDPNYLAVAAAAFSFAAEVDQSVGAEDTSGGFSPGNTYISLGGEGTITAAVPSNGTLIEAQLAKTNLMWSICRAVNFKRPLLGNALDTTQSNYSKIANSIVALYLETSTTIMQYP